MGHLSTAWPGAALCAIVSCATSPPSTAAAPSASPTLAAYDARKAPPKREGTAVSADYPCTPSSELSGHSTSPSIARRAAKNEPLRKDDGTPMAEAKAPLGGQEAELIRTTVHAEYPAITRCYEDALRRTAAIAGRVSVRFTIERSGEVTDAHAVCTSLADRKAVACIVDQFRQMKFFPPPKDVVEVVYPFSFSPE
jgi:TonB family protein